MSQIIGHISQVIGPVVDVYFEGTESDLILPSIHDALEIKRHNGKKLIVEVQQHIGENTVRTVAMDSTDGLQRGRRTDQRTFDERSRRLHRWNERTQSRRCIFYSP